MYKVELSQEAQRFFDRSDKPVANIREAIELYVEDCRDAGDPVPTEAGKEFVDVLPRQNHITG